jgi:hypothetical protein
MLSTHSFDPSNVSGESRNEETGDSSTEYNEEDMQGGGNGEVIKQVVMPVSKTTPLCSHANSCRRNAIKSFVNIFKWSFILKISIQYLTSMSKILKIRSFSAFHRIFLSWNSNKDTFRFALVLALINSVYKAALCAFRRILKNDKLASPIAGLLAGCCLFFDVEWRRNLYAVLMVSKMVDALMTMITNRVEYVREQEYVNRDNIMFLMLTGCMGLGQYHGFFEHNLLNKSYYK